MPLVPDFLQGGVSNDGKVKGPFSASRVANAGRHWLRHLRGARHVPWQRDGSELAIVAASGLVYLAAAALRKPSTAWLVFFVSVVVITAAKVGLTDFDATWVLLVLAVLFVGYGLLRGATRPAGGLPLQTVAMIVFGAVAAIAVYVDEAVGAYLVAAGLFAHAGWDIYHHWTNKVVARSLAEFCFVLDVLLAVAIAVVAVRG